MKKLLCLVLALVMVLSCFSAGMTAFAKGEEDIRHRPDGSQKPDGTYTDDIVGKVIDPILYGKDTVFSDSLNEIGYDSVDNLNGSAIKEETFDYFIGINGNDAMFGITFDKLYSKDQAKFFWTLSRYKLAVSEVDFDRVLSDVNATKSDFISYWNNNHPGEEYDVHDVEAYAAYKGSKRSVCIAKGEYDACAEALNSYRYNYSTKAADKSIFADILETKILVYNEYTKKDEVHYDYYYNFNKGDFSRMRVNGNNQINNTAGKVWSSEAFFETVAIANKNVVAIANFIGLLLDPGFTSISDDIKVFSGGKKIKAEEFFRQVTILSGLDKVLQDYWCSTSAFNVKSLMSALGVNIDDNVLRDIEVEKGEYMGARILTDMFREFFKNPVVYLEQLVQLFCKNYKISYKKAFELLFTLRYSYMYAASNSSESASNGKYPMLERYTGKEFNTIDDFINFISDCLYVARVDRNIALINKLGEDITKKEKEIADTEKEILTTQANIISTKKEVATAEDKVDETYNTYISKPTNSNKKKWEEAKNNLSAVKAELSGYETNLVALENKLPELNKELVALEKALLDAQVSLSENKSMKFEFAPLPINRLVNASDLDELHLYYLCYFDINRAYENNSAVITKFIDNIGTKLEAALKAKEQADAALSGSTNKKDTAEETVKKSVEENVRETKDVLKAMFLGELTMIDILSFHLRTLTDNTVSVFPENLGSSVKNAIASLIQKFVDAMDSLMSLLFGWTDGLFG